MSDVNEESKWKIPYGITFEKLSKIIRLILQKNGDKNKINIDHILPVSGLQKNFLSSNLSFLSAINIIEGDNNGFQLTKLGSEFARALSLDNEKDLKIVSLEIISKSHLNDIKILIENEGNAITVDKLLKLIKTNARLSGDSISQIPSSSKTGAFALLSWFKKIDLISMDLFPQIRDTTIRNAPKTKKKEKMQLDSTPKSDVVESNNFISKTDKFTLIIDKTIDLDELELAENQAKMLFEHAKKKISN